MSIYYSLTDYSLLDAPVFIGLENYKEMARDPLFWTALKNTAVFTLFSVVLGGGLSVLLAVLLEQGLRGSELVRALVFLPTLIPVVSASIGWMWLFNGQHGLFNAVLHKLGLPGQDWLGDARLAMPSLIVMALWVVGSAVVINTAALRETPASLYEA